MKFLLLLLSASALAHTNEVCTKRAPEIVKVSKRAIRSDGLSIGMLIRSKDGRKRLMLTHYMIGSHEAMFDQFKSEEPGGFSVLWAGEVRVKDGQLVAANETSGFVTELLGEHGKGNGIENKVSNLKQVLEEDGSFSIAKDAWKTYREEDVHLDTELNLERGKNFRHEARNYSASVLLSLYVLKIESNPNILQERYSGLKEKIPRVLLYLKFIEQEKVKIKGLSEVRSDLIQLQKFLEQGGRPSMEEAERMEERMTKFFGTVENLRNSSRSKQRINF